MDSTDSQPAGNCPTWKREIYAFKVRDYTTILIGQKEIQHIFNCEDCSYAVYYVQRGDGEKYEYHEDRIEWAQFLGAFDIKELKPPPDDWGVNENGLNK